MYADVLKSQLGSQEIPGRIAEYDKRYNHITNI